MGLSLQGLCLGRALQSALDQFSDHVRFHCETLAEAELIDARGKHFITAHQLGDGKLLWPGQ